MIWIRSSSTKVSAAQIYCVEVFLTRMKSNHKVWLGCFLFLYQLFPELMVQASVRTDVNPALGAKRPERRPHDWAIHHLWSHHDYLNPLVTREHVVQLVIVRQSGCQSLTVACSNQMDGERFGIRIKAKQSHSPGYSQWPGEELAANPPEWLPQVLVIRPWPSSITPQVLHVFAI